MNQAGFSRWELRHHIDSARLANALRAATPAILYGLRLWASVCLALYVAFWLQLENAAWAGTSAAIVCQPTLGASLRRGSFRMIGTVIGAVVIVVLAALFPQNGAGFLVGLALWGAACGFFAAILRNNFSYAAALAGYTAAIIASDLLGATGGANSAVFMLSVERASEICIGIVCAGVVLSLTDFGGARHRLAAQFAAVGAEIAGRFVNTFSLIGPGQAVTRPVRRGLVARVIALGPMIDEAIGESAGLRYRMATLQTAVDGLFTTISGWRTVANVLERAPQEQVRREAEVVLHTLPKELRAVPAEGAAASWISESSRLCFIYRTAVRALVALPANTPSLRLMADATASAFLGLALALDALALLADPTGPVPRPHSGRYRMPDPLPAWITAARVFITIGVVELFWVVTAWPSGSLAVAFAAISITLLSPREDQAYAGAQVFLLSVALATILAGLIKFAVLPQMETFAGLCLALGLALVPLGALSFQPWQGPVFALTGTVLFVPLLAPANQMTYNTVEFYNSTVAVFAGIGATTLGLILLPPISPATRVRRILALILHDLRRLAAGKIHPTPDDWDTRIYDRFSTVTGDVEPLRMAQLVAGHSVGSEIIRLRHVAGRLGVDRDIDAALDAIARGNSAMAIDRLAELDRKLAAPLDTGTIAAHRLRARGSVRAIQDALRQHATYFDSGV